MKTDSELKSEVDQALSTNTLIDATDIATTARSGTVTLSGFAATAGEKHLAELTVKQVAGVRAVANDLALRPYEAQRRSDPELAREAVLALKTELPGRWPQIQITVQNGQVFLEGTVEWNYQRERVAAVIRRVRGVLDVCNGIEVQPRITAHDIKSDIEESFKRNAVMDSEHVKVLVDGSQVTLRGEVRSWSERDQAYKIAASAPGVVNVVDELTVRT